MIARSNNSKFPLGEIYLTPGASEAISESRDDTLKFLRRHVSGDWGTVDHHDQNANEEALEIGARILSAYNTTMGKKLWVITEADRASTTILLPSEY